MEQAVQVANLLFWTLVPAVVFGSKQWALLAWFLMGNLDASGQEFAATSSVGLINAVKSIAIPIFLAWRLRTVRGNVLQSLAAKLWIALTLYAVLAAFWSPFPLPAAKLVGNLVGILLIVIVFEKASKVGLVGTTFLAISIVFSLGLGVVQTYFLDGQFSRAFPEDPEVRLTSFISPQQYGALLVAFLPALLYTRLFKGIAWLIMVLLVCLALLLSGSRTWLIGGLVILILRWWSSLQKRSVLIFSHFLVPTFIIAAVVLWNFSYDYISLNLPRLAEFINAVSSQSGVVAVRTYGHRQAIYTAMWQALDSSSVLQILFGHGTSSGAWVFVKNSLNGYAKLTFDPNRIVHDEWLRALYEWGMIGLSTFTGFFVVLFVWLIAAYIKSRREIYLGVISYLIPFCIALKTENILAGAGNAVTMGFAMLLGVMWQETDSQSANSLKK